MSNTGFNQRNKVVVRFRDGRILKGYTHDFTPMREFFHVIHEKEGGQEETLDINVADLKALFFVKTLGGSKDYDEKKQFGDVDETKLRGLKIKVEFEDGEVIRGISLGYNKNKKGFFIVPIDPESNNERIYVIAGSARNVVTGPSAEQ
jgi:hypothetical protein